MDLEPDIALELLREFSASEFVGKLYTKLYSGAWNPAQLDELTKNQWYLGFERNPNQLVFLMQGSGFWEVLHFRRESDESGPYIAVALRQFENTDKLPPWAHLTRGRFKI
ncbi:MAG TPA: hypothetical protein VFQ43_05935 [Nitrososphaera sp.]|nr:hypothetical protein [Nitrososphaera sp.]